MERPSLKQAVLHKCHRCCGFYSDGRKDCEITECPLYFFMPYREKEPDMSWQQYSPKGTGLRPPKQMTDEQRESAKARLDLVRNARSTVVEASQNEAE
jgi:hypothetical protein